MLRVIGILCFWFCFAIQSYSATLETVWGELPQTLSLNHRGFLTSNNPDIEWKLISNHDDVKRYQQYYKGLPILDYQLILHNKPNRAYATGTFVKNINQDIPEIQFQLSKEDVLLRLNERLNQSIQRHFISPGIYLDDLNKAHLAYHAFLLLNENQSTANAVHYVVDGKTGDVLDNWSEIKDARVGQGKGGTTFDLYYRPGLFQYGGLYKGINQFGRFDVSPKGNQCYFKSPLVKIMDLTPYPPQLIRFPLLKHMEKILNLHTASYRCDSKSGFQNEKDNNKLTHFSYSAMNDAMFFITKTNDMLEQVYGINQPFGADLPIHVYVHIKNLDNVAAVGTIKIGLYTIVHNQVIIGDGKEDLTPSSQAILAHELAHIVTSHNADLKYTKQSGGINESFSDMAYFALRDYLAHDYPWYWNKKDWSLGNEATFLNLPLRHIDHPSWDHQSIENAADYNDKLDVHQSSGVFNRAFYLLATTPGWSIPKAFRVMLDANMNYWHPRSNFENAACGVIQATKDRNWNVNDVIQAFKNVGVYCSSGLER